MQVIRKAESGFSLSHLAEPMYAVAVSIALGALYGVCIGRIMATPSRYFNVILRHLPQGLGNRHIALCTSDTFLRPFSFPGVSLGTTGALNHESA